MTGKVDPKDLRDLMIIAIRRDLTEEERKSEVVVGDVEADHELITTSGEVVNTLNELNREDLLGEYVYIFVQYDELGAIKTAYGCRSNRDLKSMPVIAIERLPDPELDDYGQPITSAVVEVQPVV